VHGHRWSSCWSPAANPFWRLGVNVWPVDGLLLSRHLPTRLVRDCWSSIGCATRYLPTTASVISFFYMLQHFQSQYSKTSFLFLYPLCNTHCHPIVVKQTGWFWRQNIWIYVFWWSVLKIQRNMFNTSCINTNCTFLHLLLDSGIATSNRMLISWTHKYMLVLTDSCYAPDRREGGNKHCFCPSICLSVCHIHGE